MKTRFETEAQGNSEMAYVLYLQVFKIKNYTFIKISASGLVLKYS